MIFLLLTQAAFGWGWCPAFLKQGQPLHATVNLWAQETHGMALTGIPSKEQRLSLGSDNHGSEGTLLFAPPLSKLHIFRSCSPDLTAGPRVILEAPEPSELAFWMWSYQNSLDCPLAVFLFPIPQQSGLPQSHLAEPWRAGRKLSDLKAAILTHFLFILRVHMVVPF